MSAAVLVNDPPTYLHRAPPMSRGRIAALLLIAAAHVAAVAGMLTAKLRAEPAPPPAPIMVSFVAPPAPETQEPPPPPPPEPLKPRPQPTMIASSAPTAAAIEAPPADEVVPQDEPPPAPSAPPAAEITPPNFVAAYLNNPAPSYPAMSVRLREVGTVMLLVLVNAGGSADEVRVEHSSGYSRLDAAAVDVVKRRWKFVPAKQGEQSVAAWVRIPLSFELKKS